MYPVPATVYAFARVKYPGPRHRRIGLDLDRFRARHMHGIQEIAIDIGRAVGVIILMNNYS
jgi:hypothetical protein